MVFNRRPRPRGFRRSFSRTRGFRRRNPYELAQISICRRGLETGFSSCTVPDVFYHPLITSRDWLAPAFTGTDPDMVAPNIIEAHETKGITVRGIQFDYQYSCVPDIEDEAGQAAFGFTSIRTAVFVAKCTPPGSGGQVDPVFPDAPPGNMLFHSEAMRFNTAQIGGSASGSDFEYQKRFRILWRGMEMMFTEIYPTGTAPVTVAGGSIPRLVTASRHVRLRTGCTLGQHDGLFLVTEIVNPFITRNPIIGLDLLGSLVVKRATMPSRYDR